jgi:hypothetical protein
MKFFWIGERKQISKNKNKKGVCFVCEKHATAPKLNCRESSSDF